MYSSETFFEQARVSRETFLRLKEFVVLLLHWQKSFKLIGSSTVEQVWQRHILDSAQLNDYLNQPGCLVDLGSGAGFPGIVIAMLGHSDVKLIESNEKKCAFLREASRSLGIKIEVINTRIEDFRPKKRARYITSRALAPLDKLLHYSEPLLAPGGKCVFLKGANLAAELTQAKKNWKMEIQKHPSVSSVNGVVVEIAGLELINESSQPYEF